MAKSSTLAGFAGTRNRLVGDTLDVVSGAYLDHHVDLSIPGEIALTWTRTYNSEAASEQRGVGFGFRHGVDRELIIFDEGLVLIDRTCLSTGFAPFSDEEPRQSKDGLVLEKIDDRRYRLSQNDEPTIEMQVYDPAEPARPSGLISGQGWLRMTYDGEGRLRALRTADGAVLELEYSEALLVAAQLIAEPGATPETVLRYRYDDLGRLLLAESRGVTVGQYGYDEAGRMNRRVDAGGRIFEMSYDDAGRCVAISRGEGLTALKVEYFDDARQTLVTATEGNRRIFTYDETGNVTHLLVPGCCATEYLFDDEGTPLGERDAAGDEWTYQLDWTGLPTSKRCGPVTIPLDGKATPGFQDRRLPATMLESLFGDLFPYPDRLPDVYGLSPKLPARVLKSIQKMEGIVEEGAQTKLDGQGRVIELAIAQGGTQRCERDAAGNVLWYEDQDGARYELDRDSDGRIIKLRDPLGCDSLFSYTPTGALSTFTDADGRRTEYERDQLERLTGVRRNGRLQETYERDLRGLIREKKNARGEKMVSVEYGPGGLPTLIELASGERYELHYDEKGRISRVDDGDQVLERVRAPVTDKLLRETVDGVGVEHLYTQGLLSETRVHSRFVIRYEQTTEGTLAISDPAGNTHELEQVALGQVLRSMSNGLCTFHQFDPAGHAIVVALYFSQNVEGATVRNYVYSDGGLLLSRDDSVFGETNYSYDDAHRLEKIYHSNGAVEAYGASFAGDLSLRPGLDPTISLELDERGNIRVRSSGPGGRMAWYYYDSLDRLVKVRFSDGLIVEYGYDVFSRLVTRTSPEGTRELTWDGDRLAFERAPDGRCRIYIYPDDVSIIPLLFIDYDDEEDEFYLGQSFYPVMNHVGCPELIQNEDGDVAWSASVDPLGLAIIQQGADFHQPLRLPGQWYDAQTGLSFNRFRTFDPELGRFLQTNPLGLGGGTNLESLALNPLAQLNILGLGGTGFCGYRSLPNNPELMPLCEGDAPLIPTGILEIQDVLVKTRQDITQSQQKALKAIQTCRQVMSRSQANIAEHSGTVSDLEKDWSDQMRRAEDPAFSSIAVKRFLALEEKALKLIELMTGAIELDVDKRTEIALGQAWKRFTIR